ncbi:MAG: signal transduction histidine kinase [Thermoleophilia bacterium]|nr:signal transduction histidine kinase [Thermoleophilia bacterium]
MPESRGWFWSGRGGDERRAREHSWTLEHRITLLERERKDLRRILAALGEGVLAVDSSGIVLHANPTAIDLLGLDADAALGSHLFVAVPHPDLCDALEEVMRGVEQRDARVTRELVVPGIDGERILVAQVTPLRGAPRAQADADVAAEGAVAVVRDVTELRRLEVARQEFFGNVSHELKTPITAIRGSLETIVDDPGMPDEVRSRFLDGAVRHSVRLNTLVNDLLALARLEDDPGALRRAPLDLAGLAGEIVQASEGAAARRAVSVGLTVVGGGPGAFVIGADEEAMRQAISNLVSNAIAYSEAGDAVDVRLERRGQLIEVEVRDEGSGIPPEAIERVFERFYRVDAARSRELGGTGIGLSIVKHVAQAHGGTVEVTSELGVGSWFQLRIPVSRPAEVGTPPA